MNIELPDLASACQILAKYLPATCAIGAWMRNQAVVVDWMRSLADLAQEALAMWHASEAAREWLARTLHFLTGA